MLLIVNIVIIICFQLAASASNMTSAVKSYNKKANNFKKEDYLKIMKFSIHAAKAMGPYAFNISAAVAEILEFGFSQLQPDEIKAIEKLFSSMEARFREQTNKIHQLQDNIRGTARRTNYDMLVLKPLTHTYNRYMDIKKYKNATQARQPFVRQCRSNYSLQHVLDDIERYTITQCSLLSKDIIQSFVAAQKKLHYYEKKFGFSFENNSTLLEFKTGFLYESLSANSSIDWYLNEKEITTKEMFLIKMAPFGKTEARCWLKEIYVASAFKRRALESGSIVILMDLAKIREMVIACANISKYDVKFVIGDAFNRSEKIANYLKEYSAHLLESSWPETIQQRIVQILPDNKGISNETADFVKIEINNIANAKKSFHVLINNIVDDDPDLIMTICQNKIECLNFVEDGRRIMVYPYDIYAAQKKSEKSEIWWNENHANLKQMLDDNAGESVTQIYNLMVQRFPEMQENFKRVSFLSDYRSRLTVGVSLGDADTIQLYQTITSSYGQDVTEQDYNLYFLM